MNIQPSNYIQKVITDIQALEKSLSFIGKSYNVRADVEKMVQQLQQFRNQIISYK